MKIYKIEHTGSGKKYIGQTTEKFDTYKRKRIHDLENDNYHNPYLQRAWNKYGKEHFTFEIIEECQSIDELNEREFQLIEELGEYNLRPGGRNFKMTEEQKEILRKTHSKLFGVTVVQHDLKGKPIKEFDSIMQAARETGLDESNIRRAVHGEYGRCGDYQWSLFGGDIGYYNHGNSKGVIQLDQEGNKIAEFDTLQKAAEEVGGHASNISKVCNGKAKTAYGYIWKSRNLSN